MKREIESNNAISSSQPKLAPNTSWSNIYDLVKKYPFNGLIDITLDKETQFTVLCMNDDAIALQYFWTNGAFTEPQSLKCWRVLAGSSKLTIDVGAYTGLYSLIAASLTRSPIYSYEPISFIYSRLATNAMLNKYANIKFRNLAVSNKSETIKIGLRFGPRLFSSGSSIMEAELKKAEFTQPVNSITLDSEHQTDHVELIKIDVENAEILVLEGAKNLLAEHKPVLLIETNSETHARVVLLLDEIGYSHYPIEASGDAFNYLFYCEGSKLYPSICTLRESRIIS